MWIKTPDDYRVMSKAGTSRRWQSEWATEPWTVNPIDMMSVEEFMRYLVTIFGESYLENVRYEWRDGEFVPAT